MVSLHVPLKKVLPFVQLVDHRPGRALDAADLASRFRAAPVQASLFST